MKSKAQERRPLFFIGTTKEALAQGRALESNLVQDHQFEVNLWPHAFSPSDYPLDALLRAAKEAEYAAFILTPDDRRQSRGKQALVPRDNLIFELGLFTALKGRGRVFVVMPRDDAPALPTDYLAITTIPYLDKNRTGWISAMSAVANIIAEKVNADVDSIEGKAQTDTEDMMESQQLTRESPPCQIAVCSVEASFTGHIPVHKVGRVASCLEDALEASLACVKQSAAAQAKTPATPDNRLFREELHDLLEQTHVSMQGATATVVWELPQGIEGKKLEVALPIVMLDFVSLLQRNFRKGLLDLGLAFVEHLPKVGLKVALSTGKALLRSSRLGGAQYMGPCPDDVAALRRAGESGEVVANFRVAPYLFMERLCAGEGRRVCKPIGSNGEKCAVWITDKPLLRRRPKEKPLQSLKAVLDWTVEPYEDHSSSTVPPLTTDDLISVFKMREVWESRFAKDLSTRVLKEKDARKKELLLRRLMDTIKAMKVLSEGNSNAMKHPEWRKHGAKFHSQIAELSDPKEQDNRRRFTEWIYDFTGKVYLSGMVDPKNHSKTEERVVIEEHCHIFDLIRLGPIEKVEARTTEHLVEHYGRASKVLLQC